MDNGEIDVEGDNYYLPRAMSESSYRGTTTSISNNLPYSVSAPLLGEDEILQIKILYGGGCRGKCSRVHTMKYVDEGPDTLAQGGDDDMEVKEEEEMDDRSIDDQNGIGATTSSEAHAARTSHENNNIANATGDGKQRRVKAQIYDKDDQEKDDGSLSSPSYWEKVHYRFARDDALLHLDETTISLHNITFVNVTLTERCLSTGSDDGK